jgi:hypothetical protein
MRFIVALAALGSHSGLFLSFSIRLLPILLQKDFWPLIEEHFFTLGREWGILIQKSIPSDSIIAHFANHVISATFATLSACNSHFCSGPSRSYPCEAKTLLCRDIPVRSLKDMDANETKVILSYDCHTNRTEWL